MICLFLLIVTMGSNSLTASDRVANPAEVIRSKILQPDQAIEGLRNFTNNALTRYHDEQHNNLMHITIQAMLNNKSTVSNYVQFQESIKPLMLHLAAAGVRINELNDNHDAPHFFVYRDDGENQSDFADFLDSDLGAHPTYFSLEPEKRKCNRALAQALRCTIL